MARRSLGARGVELASAVLASVVLGACGTSDEPHDPPHDPPRVEPAPSAPPRPRSTEPAPIIQAERTMMSTIYQMAVVGTDEPAGQRAMALALDEIERLEPLLSEWQPSSEVSEINRAAGQAPVHVGDETFAVVARGEAIATATDGAFDLTWAALRGLYLFQRGQERVPSDAEIAERLPLVGYRDLVVDEAAHTVSLRRAGMAIGTGGIAKGYALDRAQEILIREGFPNFMIFGGGQVQVHGLRGDRPWRVGIQHPRRDDYIAFLEATDCSLSTSGDYEHYFIDAEGQRWHHIIDLHTGRPAHETVQVTLWTERGIDADALSTACFVMGPERCLAALPNLPGHPEAVIIDADLRVHLSPGARERVTFRVPLDDGRLPL